MSEIDIKSRPEAYDGFFNAAFWGSVLWLAYKSGTSIWFNNEVVQFHVTAALAWGSQWSWRDLAAAFDYQAYDGLARARFLSNLFNHINGKLAARSNVPVNINVLFIISGLFLFRSVATSLMGRRVGNATGALLAVSPAAYSGSTMVFHSAKPLTFLALAALAYIAGMKLRQAEKKSIWLAAYGLIAFLALNCDETGLLAICLSLVLALAVLPIRAAIICAVVAATSFFAFMLWTFVLAPHAASAAGYPGYDYWGELGKYPVIPRPIHLFLFNTTYNALNAFTPLIMHYGRFFAWTNETRGQYLNLLPSRAALNEGIAIVICVTASLIWIGNTRFRKSVPAFALGLAGAAIFTAIIQGDTASGSYYGHLIAIPAFAFLAVGVSSMRKYQWAGCIGLIFMIAISARNVVDIDYRTRVYDGGGLPEWSLAQIKSLHDRLKTVDMGIAEAHKMHPGAEAQAVFDRLSLAQRATFLRAIGQGNLTPPTCEVCVLVEQPGKFDIYDRRQTLDQGF